MLDISPAKAQGCWSRSAFCGLGGAAVNGRRIHCTWDRGNPAMAEKELMAHVARIKRSWASDVSIQISGLDT